MSTRSISSKEIKREKHEIDAEGQVLGRLATYVARLLMGKDKVSRVPYLDQGDFVRVKNVSKVELTGNKVTQKTYVVPTRRQGHLRTRTFREQRNLESKKFFEHAVKGMLPKNRLGAKMITRLKIES